MTAPLKWRPRYIEQMLVMHKSGSSVRDIAEALPMSREAIRAKLRSMGLRNNEPDAPKVDNRRAVPVTRGRLDPVRFPQFEDHADGDRDRHMGRKPQRCVTHTPSQSASAWAVR